MTDLRQLARGRACTIRVPDVCNRDPQTTVGCHFRLIGLAGMGMKPSDLHIAFGCSACHTYVDTHKDAATQLAFAHGVMRTQDQLVKEGVIRW
jgi:hypothetical protein